VQKLKEAKMQSFTCLVKKEGNQYASLCVELDVASCGNTKKEAIEGLKNAIEAYLEYMTSEGRENEIYRPVPMDELFESVGWVEEGNPNLNEFLGNQKYE
jgi:predicted RNase H-like HicB family nuclease